MMCQIGSFAGDLIAALHLIANVVIVVSALHVAAMVFAKAGLLLRLVFIGLPIGAGSNVLTVLMFGCRDVSGGELIVTLSVGLLMLWLAIFHRDRVREYRRENAWIG